MKECARRALQILLSLSALGALGCGSGSLGDAYAGPDDLPCEPCMSVTVAPRFGLDANANGLPDLPNSIEYVTSNVEVHLNAALAPLFLPPGGSRQWVIQPHASMPGDWPIEFETESNEIDLALPPGEYTVRLRRIAEGAVTHSLSSEINVRDYLIVSLGDSYSSGEGNPERPIRPIFVRICDADVSTCFANASSGQWADDGSVMGFPTEPLDQLGAGTGAWVTDVNRDHHRSHRSTLSWPAQLAMKVEALDAHSSVTFLSLAASGATIDEGVLGEYGGVSDEVLSSLLPAMPDQISQADSLTAGRTIDAFLVTVGGNDIGFANVVRSLIVPFGEPEEILRAVRTGQWSALDSELEDVAGLDALPERYARLRERIDTDLAPAHVYILQYADPTTWRSGGAIVSCPGVGGDAPPPPLDILDLEIDPEEIEWARANVIDPLNSAIRTAAADNGWILVGDVSSKFEGHGYCARDPYPAESYPGNPFPDPVGSTDSDVRWIRKALESTEIQKGNTDTTWGTLHPNEFGHASMAQRALDHLELDEAYPDEIYSAGRSDKVSTAEHLDVDTGDQYASTFEGTDRFLYSLELCRAQSVHIQVWGDTNLPGQWPLNQPWGRFFSITGQPQEFAELAAGEAFDVTVGDAGHYVLGVSGQGNDRYNPLRAGPDRTASWGAFVVQVRNGYVDPDDQFDEAHEIGLGSRETGYCLELLPDVDMFRVSLEAGVPYAIDLGNLKGTIRIFASSDRSAEAFYARRLDVTNTTTYGVEATGCNPFACDHLPTEWVERRGFIVLTEQGAPVFVPQVSDTYYLGVSSSEWTRTFGSSVNYDPEVGVPDRGLEITFGTPFRAEYPLTVRSLAM